MRPVSFSAGEPQSALPLLDDHAGDEFDTVVGLAIEFSLVSQATFQHLTF